MPKLMPGDRLPDFTVDTVQKKQIKLSEIIGGKTTALVVLRYIGCPVCRLDVHMLTQRYPEFRQKNANVAVVMQSTVEMIQKELAGNTLPFYLICDPELAIYKAFDIRAAATIEELLGDSLPKLQQKGAKAEEAGFTHGAYEGIEEQLPAFFLINGDMVAEEVHYAKNLMDMPVIDEMLAKLC